MHIKEIVIEGFKSYSQRTVLSHFDPQFNAITGLNGSGKSNIMDAILFVLGLSQFSIARVTNLMELVYKQGQAGITKASVNITFDNRDSKRSPQGYSNFEEIQVTRQIINGKTKYLLNGKIETNNKIKNLFKSVQLNIDNPHFLVAQGKITKITNLKPEELVSMMEETAGTALYCDKKREAKKIIEKKETKLQDIDSLLKSEIEPQLEKLRKEKEQFIKFKNGEQVIASLNRKIKAYEYFQKQKFLQIKIDEIHNLQGRHSDIEFDHDRNKKSLEELKIQLEELKNQTKDNSEYQEIEKQCQEQNKTLSENDFKNAQKIYEDHQKDKEDLEKQELEMQVSVPKLKQNIEYQTTLIAQKEGILKEKQENFEDASRKLDNRKNNGVFSDMKSTVYAQQRENEKNINCQKIQLQKVNARIKLVKDDLEIQKNNMKNNQQDESTIQASIKNTEANIDDINDQIKQVQGKDRDIGNLKNQKNEIDTQIYHKKNQIEDLQQKNWLLKFNYQNPQQNFNRQKVYGRVLQLIEVNESKYIQAIEYVAGGRLGNIVVDDQHTAQLLFKNRCFGNQTVTLLPCNKTTPQQVDEKVAQRARQIAKDLNGFAEPAFKLIKFNPEVKNPIMFIFGKTFVCSSLDLAKKIAFDSQIRIRCVTFDGDVVEPSGTLSGGFVDQKSQILLIQASIKNIQNEISLLDQKAFSINEQIAQIEKDAKYQDELQEDLQQAQRKLNNFKENLRSRNTEKNKQKQEFLEKELMELQDHDKILQQEMKKYEQEKKDLEKEIQNSGSNSVQDWEKKLRSLEKDLNSMKLELEKIKKQKSESIAEVSLNETQLKQITKNIQRQDAQIKQLQNQNLKKQDIVQTNRDLLLKLKQKKDKLDQDMQSNDNKIKEANRKQEKLIIKIDDNDKEIRSIEKLKKQNEIECQDTKDLLRRLEEQYDFIRENQQDFGKVNTEFDFSEMDYEKNYKHYQKLRDEQEMLKRRVNQKVETMSNKVEREFQVLMERKQEIEQNKFDLFKDMDELDIKRKSAIDNCYHVVNQSFGNIFSSLLPNASAKVIPKNIDDISEGLEINVKLGSVWKTSLSELSGGQRSLLALSFMLSLLQYKPAPFYILDEIDAALDLSHTENIGLMIKKNFPQSQFVIISLKEGMFNNANALFKCNFLDGGSRVNQIQLKHKR